MFSSTARYLRNTIPGWLDSGRAASRAVGERADRIDWIGSAPFLIMHLGCLAVFWVGFSWFALSVAVSLYALRMFFVTGFYHRYFSHRTFKTSRAFQFVMALAGCCCVQRDPMWWAAHHRHHHVYSDEPEDPHSPRVAGFLQSHIGWFLQPRNSVTRLEYVRDWAKFPELRFLNRFDWLPVVGMASGLFFLGVLLARVAPSLETSGLQMLVWGFCVSTVLLAHLTYSINSIAHVVGRRRYKTSDDSRNNFLLALLTLGEGWHNNHHHYPGSTRQGFYWWEVDITYYGLKVLSWLGLIWDLRPVPPAILHRNLA